MVEFDCKRQTRYGVAIFSPYGYQRYSSVISAISRSAANDVSRSLRMT
jgi:hypothetical protein